MYIIEKKLELQLEKVERLPESLKSYKTSSINNSNISNWIVQLQYPLLDYINYYIIKNYSVVSGNTGDMLPFSERYLKDVNSIHKRILGYLSFLISFFIIISLFLPYSVNMNIFSISRMLTFLYYLYYGY